MDNPFRFFIRYHYVLLFVLLEIISVAILLNSNKNKNIRFMSSANDVSGFFSENFNVITEYFSLKEKNEQLASEVAKLRNSSLKAYKSNSVEELFVEDTVYKQQYLYYSARVVNNSINKNYNYITINKGRKQGIKPDMAVVSTEGIVGVVGSVSENYSSVISVLNKKLGISAKIKKNGYFGSLSWAGKNCKEAKLKEIPNHVKITNGDTIITSGYSLIFPEGIPIGTIKKIDYEKGGNFYEIIVSLNTNFQNVSNVYIIHNLFKEEQDKLEKLTRDD